MPVKGAFLYSVFIYGWMGRLLNNRLLVRKGLQFFWMNLQRACQLERLR